MGLIKTTVQIPEAGNDGKPWRGYTTEAMIEYSIGFESWFGVGELLKIVRWACGHFRQEAIYVEVAGIGEAVYPQ